MSKTNLLREIIQSNLNTIVKSAYREMPDKENFPYAVYDFETIDLGDINRDDLILTIDLWGIGKDTSVIEDLADSIEKLFSAANIPGEAVLPTFYRISRKPIDDEDKRIIRRQLKFQIQNYEIGG